MCADGIVAPTASVPVFLRQSMSDARSRPMLAMLHRAETRSASKSVRAVGTATMQFARVVNGIDERPHAGHSFYLLTGPARFTGQNEEVVAVTILVEFGATRNAYCCPRIHECNKF